ncbi:hypothetical protein JS533_010410 [Bifidobacterium amazonense]|uniref:Uncharacterized protein n=1 Tax=Bifidobacterium amazonense TaxID=2809027 RepID=A0ABS9VX63_9BIFI|nr:hypothetical protein [Bifidobacterium amazonense]MCH9276677.1 hypothetical protein [Bifidobacterium amazonense]
MNFPIPDEYIPHLSALLTVLPIAVVVLFVISIVAELRLSQRDSPKPGLVLPVVWIALGIVYAIGWNVFVMVISGAPIDVVGPMIVMSTVTGMFKNSIPGLVLFGIHLWQRSKVAHRKEIQHAVEDL